MFFAESFHISESDWLRDRNVMDSSGLIELIADVEETFGIDVYDEDLTAERLDCPAGVCQFISWKQLTQADNARRC
jgi:acyl carrier protein